MLTFTTLSLGLTGFVSAAFRPTKGDAALPLISRATFTLGLS